MDFTSASSIILYIIFAAALCGVIYFRIKNKNTFLMEQSRLKNIKELKDEQFCLQDIKRVFYKGKEKTAVYFDSLHRCFAVETMDYKNKKADLAGPYPFYKIAAVALIENEEIINQNNIRPGMQISELFAVGANSGKALKVKTNHVKSIIIKLIFDNLNVTHLNIKVLSHNIKANDENYLYYSQSAKELYEIFENALLNNWVKK